MLSIPNEVRAQRGEDGGEAEHRRVPEVAESLLYKDRINISCEI